MALRERSFPVFLPARTTTLACDAAALGSSTVHSFTAKTIRIPETTSRTFRSVEFHLFACPTSGSTLSIDQTRRKFNWNGGTGSNVDDTDATGGAIPQVTQQHRHFMYDVTSEFVSNFGSGASSSLQIDVAFVLSLAGNVINVSGFLWITVEVDDSAAEFGDYLCIPLESNVTNLTGSVTEIGTDQIPALTTLLAGYSGLTIDDIFLVIEGNQNQAASFAMSITIDSGGANVRSTITTETFSVNYRDQLDYGALGLSNSTTHKLKLSTSANGFAALSIKLFVNYRYTPPTAGSGTSFVSRLIPINIHGGTMGIGSTSLGHTIEVPFYVHEANPTLKQSGIEIHRTAYFFPGFKVKIGSQSNYRSYSVASNAQLGMHALTQRIDSGSQYGAGHTLVRGWNKLRVIVESTESTEGPSAVTGMLILNYTCTTPAMGESAKTRSLRFLRYPWKLTDSIQFQYELATASGKTPVLPSPYMLCSDPGFQVGYELNEIAWGMPTFEPIYPVLETFSGERQNVGNQALEPVIIASGVGVWGGAATGDFFVTTPWALRWTNDPDTTRLNMETARKFRLGTSNHVKKRFWVSGMLEAHTQKFTFAGQVLRADTPMSGITIGIHRSDTNELVATATTDGSGNFSVSSPGLDPTLQYYAQGLQNSNHMGRSQLAYPVAATS